MQRFGARRRNVHQPSAVSSGQPQLSTGAGVGFGVDAIPECDAHRHRQRGAVFDADETAGQLRALGQGDTPDPDIFTASLASPGYLLICSDGLWGVIPEERIFQNILDAPNPQRACQNMVDAANMAGGPDNISVLLIRMSE